MRDQRDSELDLNDRDKTADVLYALCSLMSEDCEGTPREVLDHAATVHDTLSTRQWRDDEMSERETILCSLAFLCWRAARLLGRSFNAQQWEIRYRVAVQDTFEWSLIGEACLPHNREGKRGFQDLERLSSEELFRLLLYLRERCDVDPQMVSLAAIRLHKELSANTIEVPGDLRLYFLGESARLAGATVRNTGVQEEAIDWLDIAAKHFQAGPNREPELARVSYLRFAILYRLCGFDAVYKSIPALAKTFQNLGMQEDLVKCRILWAASLKSAGECERALGVLAPLKHMKDGMKPALYGWVLVELGDIKQILGDYQRGLEDLKEAARLFRAEDQWIGLADVASMMGFGFRSQGMLKEAAECFRASQEQHRQLGMRSLEAYAGILLAETYLALGAPRDAERLLLAAIPIFEEQSMVADAVAAVRLLRASIRQRKLDPEILRDLRERLFREN